jgi:RNA polymerase sigma-70 factor (ECF subfamily)
MATAELIAPCNTPTGRPTTVAQLVFAAQQGDRGAMGELISRYQPHVLAVALRRLRDENEAQELCQEVFLQVILKLGQLRQPESFVGWVTRITRRMAINRAVRRPPAIATEPQTMEATCVNHRTPDVLAMEAERAASVHGGLNRLRATDRATLEAFYVRGQSLLEMSDHFQAPVGTIKRRLHVARQRLAKEVEALVTA